MTLLPTTPGGPKAEEEGPPLVIAPNLDEGLVPDVIEAAELLVVLELVLLSKVVVKLFTVVLLLLLLEVIAAASVWGVHVESSE